MKKKKKQPNLLFVEIAEPSSTRRDVLMAAKDVLDILKRREEYKEVQAEKQKVVADLGKVIGSLHALNNKLRSKMPKTHIQIPEDTSLREKEEDIFKGPSRIATAPKSKLDELQEELERIESRLGALE